MPWFSDRAGSLAARDNAASSVAFRFLDNVGTPDSDFAAQ